MTEQPKDDPRQLLERLERAEKRSRRFMALATALYGFASEDIDGMESGEERPPAPKVKGWLSFQRKSLSRNAPVTTYTKLDVEDKAALREALEVLSRQEVKKAHALAAQLGTKAKV